MRRPELHRHSHEQHCPVGQRCEADAVVRLIREWTGGGPAIRDRVPDLRCWPAAACNQHTAVG